MSKIRCLGLDVQARTIAVAVSETNGQVRSVGVFPNSLHSLRKIVQQLGPADRLRACYEAGPTGFVLYWPLTALGVACDVIAPSLIPTKGWRPRQDGSPGCGETGALPPRRRSDANLGPHAGSRSDPRPRSCS